MAFKLLEFGVSPVRETCSLEMRTEKEREREFRNLALLFKI
jgi:hypothetical protein